MRADDGVEEAPCRGGISPLGYVDVDDMAVLVNGALHLAPPPGDLEVGLVNEPAAPDVITTGPCRVDQQRSEALHPPVDRDVIDLDTALCEQPSTSR